MWKREREQKKRQITFWNAAAACIYNTRIDWLLRIRDMIRRAISCCVTWVLEHTF